VQQLLAQDYDGRSEDVVIEDQQILLWQSKLKESSDLNGEAKIDFLSLGLRNMAFRHWQKWHDPRVDTLYREIQVSMMEVPGHAEHFKSMINAAQGLRKEALVHARDGRREMGDYSVLASDFWNKKTEAFRTLYLLPSPETIRVLGDYLADDWVSPIPIDDDGSMEQSLAHEAVNALGHMALRDMPVEYKEDSERAQYLVFWRQWYESVKNGKRTFRFLGDPTEYDLDGPASNEKLARIEHDRVRDAKRNNTAGDSARTRAMAVPQGVAGAVGLLSIAIVAGCALVAAAVGYFLRGRRTV